MVVQDLKGVQRAAIEEWAKSAGLAAVDHSEGEAVRS